MRRNLLMTMAGVIAFGMSACQDSDESLDQGMNALQVSVQQPGEGRAVVTDTQFGAGSSIGISLYDAQKGTDYEGQTQGYVNIPYRCDDRQGRQVWSASANPVILSPTEGKAVAYYPYAAGTNIKSIPVETASQTDYMYSDWVTGISSTNPKASFQMNHALCAVQVDIVNESYVTPDTPGQVTSVSVTSSKLATGASLDITAAAAGPAQSGLSAFTGAGQAIVSNDPFKISQTSHSTRLLAVPMDGQGDLTVRVVMDGKTYAVPVTNVPAAFQQGKNYIVSLTAKGGEAPFALNSVAVTNWNEMPLVNPEMNPGKFEEIDQYVVKIEVPTDNFTFYSNVREFTGVIDWGDNSSTTYNTLVNISKHVYTKKGTYFVIAKGKCNKLSYDYYENLMSSGKAVTDIVYIGGGLGITDMSDAFLNCRNLRLLRKGIFDNLTEVRSFDGTFSSCTSLTSIPVGLFDGCTQVTDFRETFNGCSSLQSIPAGLFDKCTEVMSFSRTFEGCSSLQSIPAGLFDKCTKVTNIGSVSMYYRYGTFGGCTSLKSIPAGLFDKCTEVTNFDATFSFCTSLTDIPAGLFDKCTKVRSFARTFEGCSGLQSIPAGLFDSCTQVWSFHWTFEGCSGLQSVPAGLFDKCAQVTEFYWTFQNCSSLQSIPAAGLFDGCTQVKKFDQTFMNCSSLQSIPAGLFDKCNKVTSFFRTFNNCSNLTNIPAGLFDGCTQVKEFTATFSGCRGLQSIPQGLFDKCTRVTSFGGTFEGCRGLQSVPAGLFDKCTQVTSFGRTFDGCSLQSIPAGLFDKNVNVTWFGETFGWCSSLQSIPQGLFDKCTQVTNFNGTFEGCSGLQSVPAGLFDKCTQVTDFAETFRGCSGLTGESPYTEVYDEKQQKKVKVHLYERQNYPTIFTSPTSFYECFYNCVGLDDYKNNAIPNNWKVR